MQSVLWFLRGPLVWIALLVFVIASAYKVNKVIRMAKDEKVIMPYLSAYYGLRSIFRWVIPFSTHNMRIRPLFTLVSFSFHVSLLATPLFLMDHAVLWHESWGVRWASLPGNVADVMTVIVMVGCAFFMVRRVVAPQVRNVTSWDDFALALLVASPFVTGFVAHHQWLPYRAMLVLHIVCGAAWLVAIPFTRLAHMLWFFLTRTYVGSEFGYLRNARDW